MDNKPVVATVRSPYFPFRKEIEIYLKDGEVSDGYHTFQELYDHRSVLFVALCNFLYQDTDSWNPLNDFLIEDIWKSRLHEDGTMFDGMFIAGINLPNGMITYHLENKYWYTLLVHEMSRAPKWDGHNSQDVVNRLLDWATG